MPRRIPRPTVVVVVVVVLVCSCAWVGWAVPAAGLDIGDLPSLPWEGVSDHGLRLDYERERLPEDVPALLTRDARYSFATRRVVP